MYDRNRTDRTNNKVNHTNNKMSSNWQARTIWFLYMQYEKPHTTCWNQTTWGLSVESWYLCITQYISKPEEKGPLHVYKYIQYCRFTRQRSTTCSTVDLPASLSLLNTRDAVWFDKTINATSNCMWTCLNNWHWVYQMDCSCNWYSSALDTTTGMQTELWVSLLFGSFHNHAARPFLFPTMKRSLGTCCCWWRSWLQLRAVMVAANRTRHWNSVHIELYSY